MSIDLGVTIGYISPRGIIMTLNRWDDKQNPFEAISIAIASGPFRLCT